MPCHQDPLGIISTVGVHLLLYFGDYVCVYHVIEYGKHESVWRTFGALLTHFFLLMAVIAHLRACFADPGYVPLSLTKIDFSSDLEKMDPNQKKKKKKEHASILEWTVCTKCETYRPPRSHHCRICGRCVRRMDHHCPWINNCVGELNIKYFFLFVVYTGLFSLYGVTLIATDWMSHWSEDDNNNRVDKVLTIIAFFEGVIFGLFVTAVGGGQAIAVLCDRNAIEIRRYGTPTGFPTTPKMLLVQAVCGRGSKFLWLLPCVKPRIPDPVPPSKIAMMTMIQTV